MDCLAYYGHSIAWFCIFYYWNKKACTNGDEPG